MNANEEKQTVFHDVNVTEKNNQEERTDIQIFTNTIGMLNTKYCLTLTIYIYIDELELQTGFMYNLNAVKEIVATESFHTLDQRTRKCDSEDVEDCKTKKYLNKLLTKCGCFPLNMITNELKELDFN